jgi:L-alanine-DL-glutamate epimerase-like enolase superfamily enzyme
MSLPVIRAVRARPLTAHLKRPWATDVRENHFIIVDIETSDGHVGTGFTWTPTVGASAVRALLVDDIAPRAIGLEADPERVWNFLWAALHEAGGGGVTSIALAGLDLALWDLTAKRARVSLADFLGTKRDQTGVYGSGINLHYSLDELVAQMRRFVDAGYNAVKVKVGLPDIEEDADRVSAVRDAIGPDRQLMIDANQRWDLNRAIRGIARLAASGLHWVEEPLRADDLSGYRALHQHVDVPIALGENLHTIHRFRDFLEAGVLSYAQPNVVRVGGITNFLRIAALASDFGVPVAPHLLPEVSGQLALALSGVEGVEQVEDAELSSLSVLSGPSPVRIEGGRLRQTGAPGLGLEFSMKPAGVNISVAEGTMQ